VEKLTAPSAIITATIRYFFIPTHSTMQPTKSKARNIEQVENLLKAVNQPYATYEQVASLTKTLLTAVKSFKESLSAENSADRDKTLRQVNELVEEVVSNYRSAVSALKQAEKADLKRAEQFTREIKELERRVLSQIPSTVDLRLAVEELQAHEIEEYDDEAIVEDLEQVEERVENLEDALEELSKAVKKYSRGSGGTMSFPVAHTPIHERFTMDGVATTVTLSQAPACAGDAIFAIRYQGQVLDKTTHYTVDGNKITLVGFVPEADTIISASYMP